MQHSEFISFFSSLRGFAETLSWKSSFTFCRLSLGIVGQTETRLKNGTEEHPNIAAEMAKLGFWGCGIQQLSRDSILGGA